MPPQLMSTPPLAAQVSYMDEENKKEPIYASSFQVCTTAELLNLQLRSISATSIVWALLSFFLTEFQSLVFFCKCQMCGSCRYMHMYVCMYVCTQLAKIEGLFPEGIRELVTKQLAVIATKAMNDTDVPNICCLPIHITTHLLRNFVSDVCVRVRMYLHNTHTYVCTLSAYSQHILSLACSVGCWCGIVIGVQTLIVGGGEGNTFILCSSCVRSCV